MESIAVGVSALLSGGPIEEFRSKSQAILDEMRGEALDPDDLTAAAASKNARTVREFFDVIGALQKMAGGK